IITQEMTTAAQEPDATLSVVTQEEVATLELIRDSGKTEEEKEDLSPGSDVPGVTQLSRRWEPLATTISTTVVPWFFEVIPTVEEQVDTVTGTNEEFTPVLGSPVTTPGIMVGEPSIFPALPASEMSSERRTVVPSITRVNTAASYGLDQLESE
ncbi:Armadillo-like helical domain-containing protein 4, partial [Saguinus oedipus]